MDVTDLLLSNSYEIQLEYESFCVVVTGFAQHENGNKVVLMEGCPGTSPPNAFPGVRFFSANNRHSGIWEGFPILINLVILPRRYRDGDIVRSAEVSFVGPAVIAELDKR